MLAAAAKQTEGKIDKYVDNFAKQINRLKTWSETEFQCSNEPVVKLAIFQYACMSGNIRNLLKERHSTGLFSVQQECQTRGKTSGRNGISTQRSGKSDRIHNKDTDLRICLHTIAK